MVARLGFPGGLALVALALSQGCAPLQDADHVSVGLLLPYTGSQAAIGSSLERGAIMAVEYANSAGGIQGRPIRLLFADTHSDPQRAMASVHNLLDQGVVAIMGPESAEVAAAILPAMQARNVLLLSPFLSDAVQLQAPPDRPWFRLAPSARALGEAVAKQLFQDGRSQTAIAYTTNRYCQDLAVAAQERFITLGGTVSVNQPLDPDQNSYSQEVVALAAALDALVLMADPLPAARLVNDLYVSAPGSQWNFYLSPNLKTESFLQNVIGPVLNGSVGVAPKLGQDVSSFSQAYRQRYLGEEPLEGTYFYFDATALLLLAVQRDARVRGVELLGNGDQLAAAVRQVSTPSGISAGWDELAGGLKRIGQGTQVYYSGLTGPILWDAAGSRALGTTEVWTIEDGRIMQRGAAAP